MQNSRYLYAHGGLSSLKEARDLLHSHAPKGEHLAYINPQEANLLKSSGGSGIMTASGIRSYGFLKKISKTVSKLIPKEISNTLDKIIPNEIKPFLPYLAAAVPFLGPMGYLGAGVAGMTGAELAALAAGANATSQMAQEGYDKRGLNLVSTGLAGLGGYLAGAGTPEALQGMKVTPMGTNLSGIDDLGQLGYNTSAGVPNLPTTPNFGTPNLNNLSGVDDLSQLGYNSSTQPVVPRSLQGVNDLSNIGYRPETNIIDGQIPGSQSSLSTLDNIQNTALDLGSKAAEFSRANPDTQDLFSYKSAQQLAPGQIAAATEQAYNAAQDALREYNNKMGNIKSMTQADLAERRYYVQRYMQMAGFNQSDIDSALSRQGLMKGGRAGYEAGSNNEGVKTIPINLDTIAKQLFGDKLDNLTYTQKESVYNRYYDLKDKKAKGGLMSLGGREMDFRAAGGFVPIGKKERADDVPARLSKNEFVFTAKAVRNAGNGNIGEGAKRMYQIMKRLEARA